MNQRPPGYEPDELPTALPRDMEIYNAFARARRETFRDPRSAYDGGAGLCVVCKNGAGHRSRTGTRFKSHGILSPGRLPSPPVRRDSLIIITHLRAIVKGKRQKNHFSAKTDAARG